MYYIYNSVNIKCIVLIKDDNKFFIPLDINNREYKEYLEWLEEGNVAEEWIPEEV